METPIASLQRAIDQCFKNKSVLARLVGVTPQNVSDLIRRGREIPVEWCPMIDLETQRAGHRVSCHELRPDFWPEDFNPADQKHWPGTAKESSGALA